MAPCVFCAIAAGERDAHVVAEDEHCLAFLDRRPLFAGHTLVVPRAHHQTLADLPAELLVPVFGRAQQLAAVMEDTLGAAGSFVAMNNRISQSVPHLHVHVVPRNPKDGLKGFFWPRHPYADEAEMAAFADRLRAGVAASEATRDGR